MAAGGQRAPRVPRLMAVLVAAAVGLASCGDGSGGSPSAGSGGATTVRIAEQAPCVCQLAFYVAVDEGIFAEHGIEASFVTEPTPLTGVLTGAAEMSMASPGQAALAHTRGADVRVLVTAQSRLTQAVFVRPDVSLSDPSDWQQVAQDLRGRRVGITTRGGSTDTNLRYILSQAGLDPDSDVQIVPLGAGPSMIAGVEAGQVEAALSYQPLTATMLARDLGMVAIDLAAGQGPAALDQPMTTGIVSGDLAADHPETLDDIVAAMDDAVELMSDPANREQVMAVARDRLAGTDDATLTELLDQLQPLLRTTYTEQDHDHVVQLLVDSELLESAIPYDQMTTAETQR